jgi:predicted PurR-regulated permease PerM
LLVILGLTLVPIVIEQATQFLQGIPNWLNVSNQNLNWLDRFAKGHNLPFNLNQIIIQIESQIQTLVGLVPGFAIGTLGRLLDTILIVVLAFYMLLYGDRLWQGLINLLPTQLGIALSTSLQWNFQRFFTGQLLLGLFMVVTLTPVFLILKVNFGLLFALLIGGFELIPFIGATLGIGLVIALVMLQGFWLALQVAIAAVVLQQIKDNVILPRLLGNFIGLNPIWIFIALLAGARVAGLLGVILSIPIAGTIKGTIEAMQALKQTQIVDRTIIPPNQPQS